MFNVKYTGSGQIEVDLPSYPSGVIIRHNEHARLNLSIADKKVIDSLKRLGLSYEKVEQESDKSVKKNKKEEIKKPIEEKPVSEVSVEEASSEEKVTKEDLMKNTAHELRALATDLGIEGVDNMSKSEISDKILEIKNA